jgi:hypothetical protein
MILHRPRVGPVLRIVGTAAGAALATVGLVAAPAAALGGAMLGVFAASAMVLRLYEQPGIDLPGRRRQAIGAAATAVWLWLIGTGLVVLLGTSTESIVVALLVVGIPAALLLRRSFLRVEPAPPALPPSAEVQAPVPAAALSTADLCLAWRRSYLAMSGMPAGTALGDLVTQRQSMLDELERRDPAGFHRWLDAGARAGGDPGRYLAAGPDA